MVVLLVVVLVLVDVVLLLQVVVLVVQVDVVGAVLVVQVVVVGAVVVVVVGAVVEVVGVGLTSRYPASGAKLALPVRVQAVKFGCGQPLQPRKPVPVARRVTCWVGP